MKLQIIIAADSYISHNPKKKATFRIGIQCRKRLMCLPQRPGACTAARRSHALAAEAMDGCGYMHAWPAWLLHDAFTETE
jgi:hypothetical protein